MHAVTEKIGRYATLALVGLVACGGSAAGVWLGLGNSAHRSVDVSRFIGQQMSLDSPLAFGHPTTLADASAKLGRSITLPNTAQLSASTAGSVWVEQIAGATVVAVTFPSEGLIVQYMRPAPYTSAKALFLYQAMASELPNSLSVTDVDGVPALATKQNSDSTGTNFGSLELLVGDTRLAVIGHYDETALRGFASPVLAVVAG